MACGVVGVQDYSVMISKDVGCKLAGRELGSNRVKVDLHILWRLPRRLWYCLLGIVQLVPNTRSDNRPKSPCLTLSHEASSLLEVSSLLKFGNGAEIPAALFHGGVNDGSAITLNGIEGGRLAFDFPYLSDY